MQLRQAWSGGKQHGQRLSVAALLLTLVLPADAVVLPEDRTDALYHYYNGGGVKVTGPALLVRKSATDSLSISGRYYADAISSASIDVITTASPYKDHRTEKGLGIDYLHGNSVMNLGLTSSTESDYLADTLTLGVSHEVNHGLTNLSLGYSQGEDTVKANGSGFQDSVNRYQYRLGITQVITRSLLASFNFEDVAEVGYLNSPYRAARVQGVFIPERYPRTRDSQAYSLRLVKGFGGAERPVQSAARIGLTYFRDTWDIQARTWELGYQRYAGNRWILDGHGRYYQQSAASFYSDNFTTAMAYMARDKELSQFKSYSLGAKASWQFLDSRRWFLDRASLSLGYDYVRFNYDNFTDVRTGQRYSFNAHVAQLYLSAWY
jgi:hypothetical protein